MIELNQLEQLIYIAENKTISKTNLMVRPLLAPHSRMRRGSRANGISPYTGHQPTYRTDTL